MSWEVLLILALVFLIGGLFRLRAEQNIKVEGTIMIIFAIICITLTFVLYFVWTEISFWSVASILFTAGYLALSVLGTSRFWEVLGRVLGNKY